MIYLKNAATIFLLKFWIHGILSNIFKFSIYYFLNTNFFIENYKKKLIVEHLIVRSQFQINFKHILEGIEIIAEGERRGWRS